jgi:hypothetical protein
VTATGVEDGEAVVHLPGDDQLIVELPPLRMCGDSACTVSMAVSSIRVDGVELAGPWDFNGVKTPPDRDLRGILATTPLLTTGETNSDLTVVSATRSRTRVTVDYRLNTNTIELVTPKLIGASAVSPAAVLTLSGGLKRAIFPPGDAIEPITLEFGPFVEYDADSVALTVDVASGLVSGDAAASQVNIQRGDRDGRSWIRVELNGYWAEVDSNGQPAWSISADGQPLDRAFSEHQCQKAEDGTIESCVTRFASFVPTGDEIREITLTAGPSKLAPSARMDLIPAPTGDE